MQGAENALDLSYQSVSRPEMDEHYFRGRPLGDLVAGDELGLFTGREAIIKTLALPGNLERT